MEAPVFHLNNKAGLKVYVTITTKDVTISKPDKAKPENPIPVRNISIVDIIGLKMFASEPQAESENASNQSNLAGLEIFAYPKVKPLMGSKMIRKRLALKICCNHYQEREKNMASIQQIYDNINKFLYPNGKRFDDPILFLLNPRSGPGKAQILFQSTIAPMLAEAGITSYKLIPTERAGHGRQIVTEADLTQYSGIVIVSGDGLLYEVIQGLMSREDSKDAIQTPLGILPAGSGNALCCSINFAAGEQFKSNMLLHSTYLFVKQRPLQPLHLASLQCAEGQVYSFLSLTWGTMADVDIESERFRMLGNARFTVEALTHIAKPRSYPGVLSFLPAHSFKHFRSSAAENSANHTTNNSVITTQPNAADTPTVNPSLVANGERTVPDFTMPQLTDPVPDDWVKIDDNFAAVSVVYQTHLGPDLYAAPHTNFNDPYMWLTYVKYPAGRGTLLSFLTEMDKGNHLNIPKVNYLPVHAFRLEPKARDGILSVDGERVKYGPIQGRMNTDVLNIMA